MMRFGNRGSMLRGWGFVRGDGCCRLVLYLYKKGMVRGLFEVGVGFGGNGEGLRGGIRGV